MKVEGFLRNVIALIVCIFSVGHCFGQREYNPHVAIGGKAGMTLSKIAFTPGIKQAFNSGVTMGLSVRYTEEKIFGLIGELKIEQRGWKEDFEGAAFNYSRALTYVQIPLLTHICFGSDKVKGFFNLGPSVGYLIGDKVSSNFDYTNPSAVEGFPITNRHVNQMTMSVSNKFDYGILGGAGVEFIIKKKHSIMLEGRYYYGLGNIFPAKKKDEFAASRGNSIEITLGYMLHIK